MEFGTNLKKALEEMGVTQRELANRMGKEETYISRIINNRYNVSWRMINDIANALNISPAYFFTDNQDELFKILLNELPEDLLEFLQSRKNQAWIATMKDISEMDITPEQVKTVVQLWKDTIEKTRQNKPI